MDISKVDLLLRSDSRVHILAYLLDGKAYPASELAHVAKIKPKTATYHLSKMKEEGILSIENTENIVITGFSIPKYQKFSNHFL